MPLPIHSLFGIVAGAVSSTVAIAALALVAWQAPQQRDNQIMALFLATAALRGAAQFAMALAAFSGGAVEPLFKTVVAVIGVNTFALVLPLLSYGGRWHDRKAQQRLVAGAAILLLAVIATYAGWTVPFAGVSPTGRILFDFAPLGIFCFGLFFALGLGAVAYIWRRRETRLGYLLLGTLIQPLTLAAAAIPAVPSYLFDNAGIVLTSVFFAHAILREKFVQQLGTLSEDLALVTGKLVKTAADAQERENNLQALIENTQDAVWSVDNDCRLLTFNQMFQGLCLLNYGVTIRPGLRLIDEMPSGVQPTWRNLYQRALLGQHFVIEEQYEFSGTRIFMEVSLTPMRSTEGRISGVSVFGRDITGRKEAEALLRDSEERFRVIAEAMPVPIVITRPLDATLVYANPALADLVGLPLERLPGLRSFDFYDRHEDRNELMRRVHHEGAVSGFEFQLRRADSELRWVLVSVQQIVYGTETVLLACLSDITTRREAEETMVRARRVAEEASQAKSSFLANMSHELRTPLNAIINYSEMLQEDAADSGQDGLVPDLQRINGAGHHLLALINDVLDISKIEAGKVELFLEHFDVAQVVEEVISTVRPQTEKNHNQLIVECPPEIGSLYADLRKISQALLNLLSNAAKFTEAGTITLRVSREQAGDGAQLRFAVQDTGIGISAEQLARLFQPFTQADASTTRKYGGTGLGLAISRHFCQMMGGDLTVSSTAGVGSVFTMLIPDQQLAPSAAPIPLPPLPAEGEDWVLVVDNDATTRQMLRRMLEREGLRVEEAADGRTGLAVLEQSRPTLMLLDLQMPDLDGFGVLRALRGRPEGRSVPVLVVTARDVTADERRQLAGWNASVAQKGGYRGEELMVTVLELIAGARRRRSVLA